MSTESAMDLKVLSPEGIIYEAKGLTSATIPLVNGGTIGVRPGHAPLLGETVQGHIRYRTMNQEQELELFSGVVEINKNIITIFTAGVASNTANQPAKSTDSALDRLMGTLVENLTLEEDLEEN